MPGSEIDWTASSSSIECAAAGDLFGRNDTKTEAAARTDSRTHRHSVDNAAT